MKSMFWLLMSLLLLWTWGGIVGGNGPATASAAPPQRLLIVRARGEVRFCRQRCNKRKHWRPLPRHFLRSGDWVYVPKGSVLVYRTLAVSRSLVRMQGPQRKQIKATSAPTLSRRLLGLWRRTLMRLKKRVRAGSGATRSLKEVRQHPAFVELLTPHNTELLKPPQQLRWKPRVGVLRYNVRLFTLRSDWTPVVLLQKWVTCSLPNICQVSLRKFRWRRGLQYFWQVQVALGAKPFVFQPYPPYGVYFRILTKTQRKVLQTHLRKVGRIHPSPQDTALAKVLLLLKAYCFEDGLQLLKEASKINPYQRRRWRDLAYCAMCQPWNISLHHRVFCSCSVPQPVSASE